jgi:hypothetical protein
MSNYYIFSSLTWNIVLKIQKCIYCLTTTKKKNFFLIYFKATRRLLNLSLFPSLFSFSLRDTKQTSWTALKKAAARWSKKAVANFHSTWGLIPEDADTFYIHVTVHRYKFPYNLFWNVTLRVSDSSSVHHQELFTVHSAHSAFEQYQDGVPSWYCSKAVYKTVWHTPLLSVQWITPDDGQRNCLKHVELHSKINLRN